MDNNDRHKSDTIGLRRDIKKTTPNRMTALWIFGTFIIVSAVYMGVWIGNFLFGGLNELAYWFGFFFTLFISSVIGLFIIVIQDNAQDIKVKIVKEG